MARNRNAAPNWNPESFHCGPLAMKLKPSQGESNTTTSQVRIKAEKQCFQLALGLGSTNDNSQATKNVTMRLGNEDAAMPIANLSDCSSMLSPRQGPAGAGRLITRRHGVARPTCFPKGIVFGRPPGIAGTRIFARLRIASSDQAE